MAGFMDMIKKAKEASKGSNDNEWIAQNTRGQILIHSLTFFETDAGKWGALNGELTKSSPTIADAIVQPAGTKIKVIWKCHGEYPLIGYKGMMKCIEAIFDPDDEKELKEAFSACFSDDESGFTNRASKEARSNPYFGARGCLVDFVSRPAKNSEERKAKGLHTFTELSWSHVKQTEAEIVERAKSLPEIE